MKTLKKLGKNLAVGAVLACSLTGCGNGVKNPDYVVKEFLGNKLKTIGVGFKYEFREGSETGPLLYTIEPNYSGKFKKALLADSYFLKDSNGATIDQVTGKIITISAKHEVYDSDGNLEKIISRKMGSGLLGRAMRILSSRDGYYVKSKEGNLELDIQETWASVLSPFLRAYEIRNPQTGKIIGEIENITRAGILFGAQTYEISLLEKNPKNVKNLALAIRIIDGIEDLEDAESSESSSKSHSSSSSN